MERIFEMMLSNDREIAALGLSMFENTDFFKEKEMKPCIDINGYLYPLSIVTSSIKGINNAIIEYRNRFLPLYVGLLQELYGKNIRNVTL